MQGVGIESAVAIVSEQIRVEVKTEADSEKPLGLEGKSDLIPCTLLENLYGF